MDEDVITISSPNYPKTYPRNVYQLWEVHVPEGYLVSVYFEHFNTHRSDSLFIGEDVDEFHVSNDSTCSRWKRFTKQSIGEMELSSRSTSVKIFFTSDYANTGSGFSIQLRAIRHLVRVVNGTSKLEKKMKRAIKCKQRSKILMKIIQRII